MVGTGPVAAVSRAIGYADALGGQVVGKIPEGLPLLALPKIDMQLVGALITPAIVISLVGFM